MTDPDIRKEIRNRYGGIVRKSRESGAGYDYANPIWDSINKAQTTTCTLIGLTEGTTYHFVVRAYDGDLESADSEEVSYTPAAAAVSRLLEVCGCVTRS